jgi:hypothetical protein
MLKQFLPQLQTTFVKALNDPNRVVRLKSAAALSHLIVIHQRADPLFMELHNTIKNTDDSAIRYAHGIQTSIFIMQLSCRETTLHALRGIITPAGDKMSDAVKKQIHQSLLSLLGYQEDVTRNCAAGCLGAICRWLPPEQLDATLLENLLCKLNIRACTPRNDARAGDDSQTDWMLRQGRGAALSVALKESPSSVWQERYKVRLIQTILSQLSADRVFITQTAVRSCGYLLQYLMMNEETLPTGLLGPFVRVGRHVCRCYFFFTRQFLDDEQ